MPDSSRKGMEAELLVASLCLRAGYSVAHPFDAGSRFDLLISKDQRTWRRIQVKTARAHSMAAQAWLVDITKRDKNQHYSKKDCDYLVFIHPTERIYWTWSVEALPQKRNIYLTKDSKGFMRLP